MVSLAARWSRHDPKESLVSLDSVGFAHRIRHGTATLLANNGMPIEELSRQMGHTTTRVTKRYAVQTPESIGRYVETAMRASGLTKNPRRRAA